MITAELSREISSVGVTFNALNQGFNVTDLGCDLWFALVLERILKFLHIGDPEKGTDIIVCLVIDKEYNGVTGGYFNVRN